MRPLTWTSKNVYDNDPLDPCPNEEKLQTRVSEKIEGQTPKSNTFLSEKKCHL